jgi:hypothetical protein
MPVDGLLARRNAEEVRQLANRAAVGEARRNVGALARVQALREEAAELIERRRRLPKDPVGVMVDETDAVQYFKKWPCCSNVSSPAE